MVMLMRLLFVICFLVIGVVDNLCAEEIAKEEYRSMAERIGERRTRQMMRNLSNEDKLISRDDYVNRKLTRGERREIRRDKKQGTYKSPTEEFDLMDKNKDGFLEPSEMNEFYVGRARSRYQ